MRRGGAGASCPRGELPDIPDCFHSDFTTAARVERVDACGEKIRSREAYNDAVPAA
jgi:hypothetical protein